MRRFGERGEGERAREREAAGPAPGGQRLKWRRPPFLRKSAGSYRFCHPKVDRREAEAAGRDRS